MDIQTQDTEAVPELSGRVQRIVERELRPLSDSIDREGRYPEAVLRQLGEAGAFTAISGSAENRLSAALGVLTQLGQECAATAFCAWCHSAFVWYLSNTGNAALRERLLAPAIAGQMLGGTGMSNPLKALAKIEPLRLRGQRVPGGFVVNGQLPQVSNLGPDHHFGTVFELEDGRHIATVVDCAGPGITVTEKAGFIALNGTRTCNVRFQDAHIPEANVLSEPAEPFLARIRTGFILMQCGIAIGIVRACIEIMQHADRTLAHVNAFLPDRPPQLSHEAAQLAAEVLELAQTPFEHTAAYQRRVIKARLTASELALRAGQAAMLHMGAKGYFTGSPAERRLREAYFMAIVTPATKDLRRELLSLDAETAASG